MTSKRVKGLPEIAQPHTKHEEIMFCIESTNDMVSKLIEVMEICCKQCVAPSCPRAEAK